jgi:LAO/AO transport system kinase
MTLASSVLSGDRLALARLLTQIENNTVQGRAVLEELFPHTGYGHLIGVTGSPGTGKSTLVNKLALLFRAQEKRVAIVAVDPSSPFTGGALLGDRIRMKDIGVDAGVFIRSMATRGSLGGLAHSTASFAQVFDAAGYEIVMIETVGAGQAEVDIARLAHTTLVVEAPGFGDDIQAIKAGILEIADILIVNKADRPGADATEKALKSMLELAHPTERIFKHHGRDMSARTPAHISRGQARGLEKVADGSPDATGVRDDPAWIPPIVRTVATEGIGVPELAEQIALHAAHLRSGGGWAIRERLRLTVEVETLVQETLMGRFHQRVARKAYEKVLNQVYERSLSPQEAVKMLVNGKGSK